MWEEGKVPELEHKLCHPAQGLRTPRIKTLVQFGGAISHVVPLSDPIGWGRVAQQGSMNKVGEMGSVVEPRRREHIGCLIFTAGFLMPA